VPSESSSAAASAGAGATTSRQQFNGVEKSNGLIRSGSDGNNNNVDNADLVDEGGFPDYAIGLIIGVGVIALLVAIAIAFVLFKKGRQNKDSNATDAADSNTYSAPPTSASDVYSPPPRSCAYDSPSSPSTPVYGSAPVIIGEYGAAPTLP
jgi:hypothetical protein